MRSSKLPLWVWYLLGALIGLVIGLVVARVGADRYIQAYPGEEYDQNLLALARYVYPPLAGIGGALLGILIVGLIRAPRTAAGWLTLSIGSVLVLATLPIRAVHGWPIAIGDLFLGIVLIAVGLKTAK